MFTSEVDNMKYIAARPGLNTAGQAKQPSS